MAHNDPLLQILILLTASVCVVAAVRKLALRMFKQKADSAGKK